MGSIAARLGVALCIVSSAAALAADPQGDIVVSLGSLSGAVAVDVSLDGSRAAAAFPPPPDADRSSIRIASAGKAPASIEVPGDVWALLFDPAGSPLYALVHRASKRHPTESTLLRIDVGSLKTLQRVTLPVTARSMDLSGERDAILVACEDEIRTFALPALTSGPLYRLPGTNLAVAAVPRSMRILVGRPNEIAVIDPRSQQGRDGIPILAKAGTPGPVADLLPGLDGDDAVARLADGRTLRLDLRTMTLEDGDPAPYLVHVRPVENSLAAVPPPPPPPRSAPSAAAEGEKSRLPELPAAVAAGAAAGVAAGAAAAAPSPSPKPIETKPQSAPAAPPPASTVTAPTQAPPPPAAAPPKTIESADPAAAAAAAAAAGTAASKSAAPASPTPKGVEDKPPAPASPPPPIEEKPKPTAPVPPPPPPPVSPPATPPVESKEAPKDAAPATGPGTVRGTVTGPAASLVVAVLLMGPDSVLREAARVAPDATGAFTFEGLEPGRYRVVADGGGKKALVSEPSFVTIVVTPGSAVVAPELKILRAL